MKEDVSLALDILADILQHSTFEPSELERERTVILQEIGQANDTPDDIVFDYFQERAFPDQAMGRPVLGSSEIIKNLSRDSVVSYLKDHYGAKRMVLSGAGNLDHDSLVALADEAAVGAARRALGRHRAGILCRRRHPARPRPRATPLGAGFPGLKLDDPDYYAAAVLSTAFGGGMSSRLFQEVREKRGLVYAINSFAHSYRDGGLFGIYAGTGEEEAAELLPVLCDEARKLDDGFAPGELARAKAQMKAGLLMSLESTSARCEQMAQHMLIHGTPFDPADIVRRIDAVDDAAIGRVVAGWRRALPTLVAFGPRRAARRFRALRSAAQRLRAGKPMAPQRKTFPRLFADPRRAAAPGRRARCSCAHPSAAITTNGRRCGRARAISCTPWEPTWPPDALSRSSFRARIARYGEDWRGDQGYNFFIFRDDETLVGGVGLSNVRRGVAETASLGYWVGEPFARQGFMTAALPLVLDFSFDRLRLHRIEAACLPTNVPSRALLKRTGFTEEGYARRYLLIDGKWQDHVLFAILREDWRG